MSRGAAGYGCHALGVSVCPVNWHTDTPYFARCGFYLETSFMFSYSLEAAKAEDVPFHSAIAPGL